VGIRYAAILILIAAVASVVAPIATQAVAQTADRIVDPIDMKHMVSLKGNVHPNLASTGDPDNICFTVMTSFPLHLSRACSDFHPATCFTSSIKSAARKSDRPAPIATNGSSPTRSVQFFGSFGGRR
jgi:hypothetical protein